MPKFMELFGYNIYFWSNEGFPLEPIHIHVSKNPHQNATKIWILNDGTTQLDNNKDNIPSKDLKRILRTVSLFSEDIISLWKDHFGEVSYYNEPNLEEDFFRE